MCGPTSAINASIIAGGPSKMSSGPCCRNTKSNLMNVMCGIERFPRVRRSLLPCQGRGNSMGAIPGHRVVQPCAVIFKPFRLTEASPISSRPIGPEEYSPRLKPFHGRRVAQPCAVIINPFRLTEASSTSCRPIGPEEYSPRLKPFHCRRVAQPWAVIFKPFRLTEASPISSRPNGPEEYSPGLRPFSWPMPWEQDPHEDQRPKGAQEHVSLPTS